MDKNTSDKPTAGNAGEAATGAGGRSRVFVWGEDAPERGRTELTMGRFL